MLTVDNVVTSYGMIKALKGVSLTAESGKITCLLGPNGAGKTTTFHMLVGFVRPDGGKVFLNGKDITSTPIYQRARAGISYLPQESSIFRRLTVEENLCAILETLDLSRQEQKDRSMKLMRMLGISHLAKQKADTLSGGERRRVEIARALVISPFFVLLDEPLTGVDPIAVGDIQKIIRRLSTGGIGVLITDHNVRETLGICHRAYILNDGVILEEGSPAKIASSPKARKVYLGEEFRL